VGSAAAVTLTPWHRAYFEVLERQAIVAARGSATPLVLRDAQGQPRGSIEPAQLFATPTEPGSWRYALSNGVALAPDWSGACARALAEAVERDAVFVIMAHHCF
jgi:ribosomal protein S12 methylthiotransferase accessory factor YcaO